MFFLILWPYKLKMKVWSRSSIGKEAMMALVIKKKCFGQLASTEHPVIPER